MAIRPTSFPLHALALAAWSLPVLAQAQNSAAVPQVVTITGGSSSNSAGIAGFGDVPLGRAPFSATVLTTRQLQDAGVGSLADITRLDAGITDAYNAPGYWGQVAVRGYTLDNRANFRRDGLPVNAETVLPLGNKAALELLKGISGIQSGTSAPGGLLNLVVKRPLAAAQTRAALEWTEPGTLAADVDLSRRAGQDGAFGWRLSANATRLDPSTQDSRGRSHLLGLATEWRLTPQTLLELEVEDSAQRQPSTPGFSVLGDRVPDAKRIDPTLNLNNQSWSLPVEFEGQTGSVRLSHAVHEHLTATAHLMQQRLTTQDRIAFPFGCSAEDVYDRYCSDGRFDFYDFRSENERRTTSAADLGLQGRTRLGGLEHRWSVGVLHSRFEARFQRQAYNYVGEGTLDGRSRVPADPTLTDENTQRDERSTEWRFQDVVGLTREVQLWAGLRHTRTDRASVRTNGSRPTDTRQSFTTPWLALAWQPRPEWLVYGSWGQGVETEVAPNRARYLNAGQALPALKSDQVELGVKHRGRTLQWQLAWFDTDRPAWNDIQRSTGQPSDACSDADPCTRREDGVARHRGLEAEAEWQAGSWSLRGSALFLDAARRGSVAAALNGRAPTNVPERSLKVQAVWNAPAVPGLALLALASHEGPRAVLPDNRLSTDGWTRLDLGLRYAPAPGAATAPRWVARLGVDNATDARAWKESPYQFGHAYLYPLAPRTWRASLSVTL